ncbi:DUF6603 domain-containing protein [Kitasatospora sp. NPDC004669]|uniref:DUF6603 domain-containing protein n=1 Tax=Kitasatospora sp. NPDC004669 TaxID=3154555 RepID=UPI0033BDC9FC
MTLTVEQLKRLFPGPGEDFVLPTSLLDMAGLYLLLKVGEALTVGAPVTVDAEALTVSGALPVISPSASITLEFIPDDKRVEITGVRVTAVLGVSAREVAEAFGVSLSGVPDALVPQVESVGVWYDFTDEHVVAWARTGSFRLVLASVQASPAVGVVQIKDLEYRLSDLPVVGPYLTDVVDFGVTGLGMAVTTSSMTGDAAAAIENAIALARADVNRPVLPPDGLTRGLSTLIGYELDGSTELVSLPVAGSGTRSGGVELVDLDFRLGLLTCQKLTAAYDPDNATVELRLAASLDVGNVSLSALGLGTDIPLTSLPPRPSWHFDELALRVGNEFGLTFTVVPPDTRLAGVLRAEWDGEITAVQVAEQFGVDLSAAPEALVPVLTGLGLWCDIRAKQFVVSARTGSFQLVLASVEGTGLVGVVQLRDLEYRLSDLPVIGPHVPGDLDVGVVSLSMTVCQLPVSGDAAAALENAIIDAGVSIDPPVLPADGLARGLSLLVGYEVAGDRRMAVVPIASGARSGSVELIDLDFEVGLLKCRSLTAGYDVDTATVALRLAASIEVGTVSLSAVGLGADITLTGPPPEVRWHFDQLVLKVGDEFALTFEVRPPQRRLAGVLQAEWTGSLTAVDAAGAFGVDLSSVPPLLVPELRSLGLWCDFAAKQFVVSAETGSFRLVLALVADSGLVGLVQVQDVEYLLSDLPLVGPLVPDEVDLGVVSLGMAAAGSAVTPELAESINEAITAGSGEGWPRVPAAGVASGLSLLVGYVVAGAEGLVGVGLVGGGARSSGVGIIDLDFSAPPFTCRRLTVSYAEPDVQVRLDASLDLAGVSARTEGLGFDVALSGGGPQVVWRFDSVVLTAGDFTAVFALRQPPGGDGTRVLSATWQPEGGASAAELVKALGIDVTGLPQQLVPTLDGVSVRYDLDTRELVLTARTARLGWMFASVSPDGGQRRSALAVRAAVAARASQLPLIGEAITEDRDIALTSIQFGYASARWTSEQVAALNTTLDGLDQNDPPGLPRLLDEPLDPGVLIWALLTADGEELPPLVLRVDPRPSRALAPGTPSPVPVSDSVGVSADGVVLGRELIALSQDRERSSQDVGRVFGPVRIRKVSLGYGNGLLFIAFDATLTMGPVQLDTIGLGLGLDSGFNVKPVLQGAGLRVDQPPLKVTGALVVREDDAFAIYIAGAIVVETGFFALQAAGSYARSRDGWSSVFLFGEIAAVGGAALVEAPPFTLTAVSAGFGVNSTLRLPAIAELGEFPLIARLSERAPEASPQEALEALAAWISPAQGRFWAAVGVEFALFKFIATRALAAVEFGDDLKVMLLGRTSVTFPRDTKPGKKVHARIDIDLKLAYQQSRGLLSLDVAVGDGSFVFDPACRLTGGIAIYLWTAGEHAGDFVITAGGYHPRFTENLPGYYPTPARLGFTWSPDSKIMVKAEGYTALTPHAFMVGGRLAATYTSGLLSAWFTAYLDVLIQWRPFYLEASLGISIGVAFTIKVLFVKVRVSIEVGIDLALWTPPFGGRVTVKVWFVSFSFDIGSKRAELDAALWPEVHEQLPEPLSITPVAGLLADVDAGELAARRADGDPVLVAAAGLVFTVDTVIPATAIHLNQDTDYATAPHDRISIRPMRKDREIASELVVTVTKVGDADYVVSDDDWTVEVIKRGAPAALWGRPLAKPDDALEQEALLPDQLAGLRFEVKLPETAGEIGPVTSAALQVTRMPDGHTPLRNSGKQGPVPLSTPGSIETIADTVNTSTTARRTGAYRALHRLGLAPGASGAALPRYADKARDYLVSSPLTTTAR